MGRQESKGTGSLTVAVRNEALRYRTATVRESVPFLFFSRFGLLKNALDRDASKPHAQINLVRCGRAGEPLPQEAGPPM